MDTYKKRDSTSESENLTNQLPSLFCQVNVRGSVDSFHDEYGFEMMYGLYVTLVQRQ